MTTSGWIPWQAGSTIGHIKNKNNVFILKSITYHICGMLVCRTFLYCSAFCVLCRSTAERSFRKADFIQTIPNNDPSALVHYNVSVSDFGNYIRRLDVGGE